MNAFEPFFNERIQPFIKESKEEREKAKKIFNISIILFMISILASFASDFLAPLLPNGVVALLELLFLIAIPGMIYGDSLIKKSNKKFKETIMPDFAKTIHPSFEYDPIRYLPREIIEETNLFHMRDSYHYYGEDLFTGKIDETEVFFSQITIKEPKRGKKKPNIVFSGLIYCFDFNKDFKGTTIVVPKWTGRRMKGFERIDSSDPEFQDKFSTYATDNVTARFILTPSFMNILKTFSQEERKNARFAFKNGKMLVAVPTIHDPFDFSIGEELDKSVFQRFFDDAHTPIEFIESFKLNTRIWNK